MPVDPLRLGDHLEAVTEAAGRLRVAQNQSATIAKRKVEKRDDLRLCLRRQIDQEVSTGNQVETGERRIGEQILHREDHGIAKLG